MRRSGTPVMLVVAGLALWFGPWRATAQLDDGAGVEVVCAAAPVDLVMYGPGSAGTDDAPLSSDACRTSAWWRTMLGTAALGVGLGSATRDRTAARVARMQAARS